MKLIIKIRDLIRWCVRSLCADFLEDISRIQQFNLSTYVMHQKAFPQFKNKHNGKDVVVVACGPTAKDYQPIKDAIHIGVNRAIHLPQVTLDYLFVMDAYDKRKSSQMSDYNDYRPGKCTKFYGISGDFLDNQLYVPSESDTIKSNAIRFRTDNLIGLRITNNGRFLYDISTQPLTDCGSVIFSALQFALWTNPRRLYLVGCDCTATGHFNSSGDKTGLPPTLQKSYANLKDFAIAYYPDTEIISVNPVGLKGLFKDWNQKDGEPMPE